MQPILYLVWFVDHKGWLYKSYHLSWAQQIPGFSKPTLHIHIYTNVVLTRPPIVNIWRDKSNQPSLSLSLAYREKTHIHVKQRDNNNNNTINKLKVVEISLVFDSHPCVSSYSQVPLLQIITRFIIPFSYSLSLVHMHTRLLSSILIFIVFPSWGCLSISIFYHFTPALLITPQTKSYKYRKEEGGGKKFSLSLVH